MKIAIIDADLIGRKKHRFPNLACMKISGYYKELGSNVILKTDYMYLDTFDKVFISKVFTDTPIEDDILKLPNVEYGGTGFYYDKAPKLPCEVEHHTPDYHLYDEWVQEKIENGGNRNDFKYYLDYSIGFNCYDERTEVLTDTGWKYFKDLDHSEMIATLNPYTFELEYHKPYEYVTHEYSGDMIHFSNKYTDLLVTPNHNMYINKYKKYELIRADRIENYYQYRFKKDAVWEGIEQEYFYFDKCEITTSNINIPKINMDLWLEFLGYYLSEGSTQYKKNTNSYIVRIAQKKDGKHNKLKGDTYLKIKQCIDAIGYKYYENPNDGFSISNKQLYDYCKHFGLQPERYVPSFIKQLSRRQIRIFLDAFIIGDGTINKSKNCITKGYISSSKKLMDDIQELLLKLGICGDIKIAMKPGEFGFINGRKVMAKHFIYRMFENNYYKEPYFSKQHSHVKHEDYSGFIYCVEVKNHIIYVRRNGISQWCGNTRGCFRQCEFCVNKNYKKVSEHSPLKEFVDVSRKKICLLDDNFFGCPSWKDMLLELQNTDKPFQFKQGLDERLLTDEKCEMLFKSKYDGDYIFAFDNIADSELIESKLRLLRRYTKKYPKFYVFCGFDRTDQWNELFWVQDIFDLMKRVQILQRYHCLPYIMRFNRYIESPYQGIYKTVSAWCNQPSFFKKKSLREFGVASGQKSARNRYITEFEEKFPEFGEYMDMKWN